MNMEFGEECKSSGYNEAFDPLRFSKRVLGG